MFHTSWRPRCAAPLAVLTAACLLIRAHGWAAPGHLVTAALADRRLAPAVCARVAADLGAYAAAFDDASPDFARSATWADTVKSSTHAFDAWHFIDTPYVVTPRSGVESPACPASVNVVWALEAAAATVRSNRSDPWSRGLMLRLLIHLVGDVHQPLHTACLVLAPSFAQGDAGGNSIRLDPPVRVGHITATELHAFWDAGCGGSGLEAVRVDAQGHVNMDDVQRLAAALDGPDVARTASTPLKDTAAVSAAMHAWAAESHQVAVNTTYCAPVLADLGSGAQLHTSAAFWFDYAAAGSGVVRQRLALGGARLAQLMNALYAGKAV